jgi:hypothetical protein
MLAEQEAWVGEDPVQQPAQKSEAVTCLVQLMKRRVTFLDITPGAVSPCTVAKPEQMRCDP